MRTVDPRFRFTDPPFRHSLPMALAFASSGDRPTAVLTGPSATASTRAGPIQLPRYVGTHDMVRVSLEDHPQYLEAAAAAQRVSGVKNVHNHLQVVLPDADSRDDATSTCTSRRRWPAPRWFPTTATSRWPPTEASSR